MKATGKKSAVPPAFLKNKELAGRVTPAPKKGETRPKCGKKC
jgi:hypothetical protein